MAINRGHAPHSIKARAGSLWCILHGFSHAVQASYTCMCENLRESPNLHDYTECPRSIYLSSAANRWETVSSDIGGIVIWGQPRVVRNTRLLRSHASHNSTYIKLSSSCERDLNFVQLGKVNLRPKPD